MKNLSITKLISVKVNFSASQWQLYELDDGSSEEAAQELNQYLETVVKAGFSKDMVQAKMESKMRDLESTGAYDTEPLWFLGDVLGKIYGLNEVYEN